MLRLLRVIIFQNKLEFYAPGTYHSNVYFKLCLFRDGKDLIYKIRCIDF